MKNYSKKQKNLKVRHEGESTWWLCPIRKEPELGEVKKMKKNSSKSRKGVPSVTLKTRKLIHSVTLKDKGQRKVRMYSY